MGFGEEDSARNRTIFGGGLEGFPPRITEGLGEGSSVVGITSVGVGRRTWERPENQRGHGGVTVRVGLRRNRASYVLVGPGERSVSGPGRV